MRAWWRQLEWHHKTLIQFNNVKWSFTPWREPSQGQSSLWQVHLLLPFLYQISVEENDFFACIRLNSSFILLSLRDCGDVVDQVFQNPVLQMQYFQPQCTLIQEDRSRLSCFPSMFIKIFSCSSTLMNSVSETKEKGTHQYNVL